MNADKSRITVVETVTHTPGGGLPQEDISTRYYRWLSSNEQTYRRTLRIGTDWEPVDLGWLAELPIGTVLIKNTMSDNPSSPDFRHVIWLGVKQSGMDHVIPLTTILAQESVRLPGLFSGTVLLVCAPHGTCSYQVGVIPE